MSGARLTGDLAARLRGLADALADGRPLLESVADRQAGNLRDHFDAKSRGGGGADGRKWRDLAPATKAAKARRGGSSRIGVDRGDLRRGLDRGAAGNVREVTRTRATVGVEVPHARHFAAARPIVPGRFPRPWRGADREAARRFLKDAAADAGF